MEKGLAIIEVTDTEVKGVHIDHEVLEFAMLNALTKKHREQMENSQSVEDRSRSRAERMKQKRRAYNVRSFWYVVSRLGIAWAVAWAGWSGMVAAGIWVPVTACAVSLACVRLGVWLGRCSANA
jgi:hypothetical protein